MPKRLSTAERFFSKVNKTDKCWEWTAYRDRLGYGIFRIGKKHVKAHRAALIISGKEIQVGLDVDHLCRNRGCVNPDHLEVVSHAENVRRGNVGVWQTEMAKTRKTCRNGHPVTLETTYLVKGGKWKTCSICALKSIAKSRSGYCATCGGFFNRLDAHLATQHIHVPVNNSVTQEVA
jgi:HNH endonuclease